MTIWLHINERRPPADTKVIVCSKTGADMMIQYLLNGGPDLWRPYHLTFESWPWWTELPEPPKEKRS